MTYNVGTQASTLVAVTLGAGRTLFQLTCCSEDSVVCEASSSGCSGSPLGSLVGVRTYVGESADLCFHPRTAPGPFGHSRTPVSSTRAKQQQPPEPD